MGGTTASKQDAEYWLKLIRAFGGQSPVLVVLNAQRRHAFDTDREYLATKYGVAREHFFRTDCADEESISELREAIEQEATKMLTPKELFPAEWWAVKQRLGAMKEHGENYLSDESYENLCKELKVAEKDTEILLRRLSDLGTVVSFPDRRLQELTVLNPEWVTDGIYRVLNDRHLREQRNGQLALCELTRILPADRWPEKRHRFLVELMRKFEPMFPTGRGTGDGTRPRAATGQDTCRSTIGIGRVPRVSLSVFGTAIWGTPPFRYAHTLHESRP